MLPVLPPILTGDHPLSGEKAINAPVLTIVKLSRDRPMLRVRRLAVSRLARNDPDMVSPDNDHANSRTTGVRALSGPLTGECKTAIGFSKMFAQVSPAPGV
jgi:hypothetical protein